MSMINDALRRARKSRPAGAGPAAGPAFRAAESPSGSRNEGLFSLAILLGAIFVLSGVLLWAWNHGGRVELTVRAHSEVADSQATGLKPAAPDANQPAPFPVPPVAATPTPPTEANTTSGDNAVAPPVEASTNLSAVVEAAKPPAPTYKLQSIFYRTKDPSAVINGKTVFVGDHVGDARVKAIDKDTATIVTPDGATTVLDLPQ